jgi:putative membrane protein
MYEWHGYGGGMMWIFWVLLIIVVLWVIKTMMVQGRDGNPTGQDKTALDILKERYAKGEIEHDEFVQKRKDLEG